jgi:hypothetical protein
MKIRNIIYNPEKYKLYRNDGLDNLLGYIFDEKLIRDDDRPSACFVVWLKLSEKELELNGVSTCFGKLYIEGGNPSNIEAFKQSFLQDRIRNWLFEKKDYKYSEGKEFLEIFRRKVKEKMNRISTKIDNKLSLDEFVQDISLWATTGSSLNKWMKKDEMWSNIKEIKEDYEVDVMDNKLSEAMLLSSEELKTKILNLTIPYEHKIVVKNESNNIRLVILGDTLVYLLMAYISFHLEPNIPEDLRMYSYYSEEAKSNFWFLNYYKCRYNQATFSSMDYSNWDAGISNDMINVIVNEIIEWTKLSGIYIDIFDKLLNIKNNCTVDGVKMENGLPTGWRWTTLINSLCNTIIVEMAIDRFKELYNTPILDMEYSVLGDDVIISSKIAGVETFMALNDIINNFGFTINKSKSWIEKGKAEFLKMKISKEGISGSVIRTIRSVLFSTEDEQYFRGDERRIIRADLWKLIINRYYSGSNDEEISHRMNVEEMEDIIVDDLWNSFNKRIKKSYITGWIQTPKVNGGDGTLSMLRHKFERYNYIMTLDSKKNYNIEKALNKIDWRWLHNNGTKWPKNKILQGVIQGITREKATEFKATIQQQTGLSVENESPYRYKLTIKEELTSQIPNMKSIRSMKIFNLKSSTGTKANTIFAWNRSKINGKDALMDYEDMANNQQLNNLQYVGERTLMDNESLTAVHRLRNNGKASLNLIDRCVKGELIPSNDNLVNIKFGEVLGPLIWNVVALSLILVDIRSFLTNESHLKIVWDNIFHKIKYGQFWINNIKIMENNVPTKYNILTYNTMVL